MLSFSDQMDTTVHWGHRKRLPCVSWRNRLPHTQSGTGFLQPQIQKVWAEIRGCRLHQIRQNCMDKWSVSVRSLSQHHHILRCANAWVFEGERVEADDGYIGKAPWFVKCPKSIANLEGTERMQLIVRRQQETVNKRFKHFGCLNQVFRNDIERHGEYFRACCVISQLSMKNGEPLFPVEYNDEWFAN